ncbi:MAG: FecR domain-containing protein, partial [Chlamydiia bacterium]|nr:FecR domain-containing protein [Chlamydiia bacterium]
MHTTLKLILTSALCLALPVWGEVAKEPVGLVISVKGNALIKSSDGQTHIAQLKSPIYVGDSIQTGFQAFVQVNFIDQSKLSIAGSTDLTVNDYAFDGKDNIRSDVTVKNGALSFMAGKIAKMAPENYKIHTAMATVGIRGSSGEIQTTDGSLAGTQPGLTVMKKGGIGLTVTDKGGLTLPDITTSGTGFVVSAVGQATFQSFKEPVVDSYSRDVETTIDKGRTEEGSAKPDDVAADLRGMDQDAQASSVDSAPQHAAPVVPKDRLAESLEASDQAPKLDTLNVWSQPVELPAAAAINRETPAVQVNQAQAVQQATSSVNASRDAQEQAVKQVIQERFVQQLKEKKTNLSVPSPAVTTPTPPSINISTAPPAAPAA